MGVQATSMRGGRVGGKGANHNNSTTHGSGSQVPSDHDAPVVHPSNRASKLCKQRGRTVASSQPFPPPPMRTQNSRPGSYPSSSCLAKPLGRQDRALVMTAPPDLGATQIDIPQSTPPRKTEDLPADPQDCLRRAG